MRVLFRGAGDVASASVNKLAKCGFQVVVNELKNPMVVRRSVAYCSAVYEGEIEVEGVRAKYVENFSDIEKLLEKGVVPVLTANEKELVEYFKPDVFIDGTISKKRVDYKKGYVPLMIGMGPSIEAGVDCDVVIETNRGHYLGVLIYEGFAAENTHVPGNTLGMTYERVLRANSSGQIKVLKDIRSHVKKGELLAEIGEEKVVSPIDGMVRGMIKDGYFVKPGLKIGDIDPRDDRQYCDWISDKARNIAGGVLEAILKWKKPYETCK